MQPLLEVLTAYGPDYGVFSALFCMCMHPYNAQAFAAVATSDPALPSIVALLESAQSVESVGALVMIQKMAEGGEAWCRAALAAGAAPALVALAQRCPLSGQPDLLHPVFTVQFLLYHVHGSGI